MKATNAFVQFAENGLAGLIVLLPLVLLASAFSLLSGNSLLDTLLFSRNECGTLYVSPIPIGAFVVFIVMGISGRSFENINLRKDWVRPIFAVTVITWMISTVYLEAIYVVDLFRDVCITSFVNGISSAELSPSGYTFNSGLPLMQETLPSFALLSGTAAIVSLFVGLLASLIWNPKNRLQRTMVGAIPCVVVFLVSVLLRLITAD